MGFANVAQSAGGFGRSESEKNLLTRENQNRMRVDNTVATARGQELDGRSQEASETTRKYVDTYLQLKAAEKAEEAAEWGFIGSLVNLAGKLASNIVGDSGGWQTTMDAVGDGFAALGAYFAMVGAGDEVELLKMQFGEMSEDTKEDQKMVAALDGNCFV